MAKEVTRSCMLYCYLKLCCIHCNSLLSCANREEDQIPVSLLELSLTVNVIQVVETSLLGCKLPSHREHEPGFFADTEQERAIPSFTNQSWSIIVFIFIFSTKSWALSSWKHLVCSLFSSGEPFPPADKNQRLGCMLYQARKDCTCIMMNPSVCN